MTLPLANKTIAVAEGRQLEDLARMLEQEGAAVLRCPLVSILDPADDDAALAWLRDLSAGRLHMVILLTGEGLRRLLACADRHGLREQVLTALARVRTVTRGPKPVQALREVGLTPGLVAKTPTTAGVIDSLRAESFTGKTVGVQLYREDNPELVEFLQQAGAEVRTVLPYVYAPATDTDHVVALLQRMNEGKIDVIVFTSSPQVDRLFEVAQEKGLDRQLADSWSRTRVAAVGPVVAENLQQRGVQVAICPEQGFQMKNLVLHIKRALRS